MTCPVCNGEGTVDVEVYENGKRTGIERKACTAQQCVAGRMTRLYREMEG